MPNSSTTSLTFYPAYCFSVAPTSNSWAKLTAADVHALTKRKGFEGQQIYFHLNHPIRWVRLIGVIVAVEEKDYRWIFHLDDSSGANIEVTCPKERSPLPAPTSGAPTLSTNNEGPRRNNCMGRTLSGNAIDMRDIDLGTVVKVKGGISEFWDVKQITLERFELIRSTSDEAAAWREMHEFRASTLDKPWHIPPDEEKRLKEAADGTKARADEKARRKVKREQWEQKRKAHNEEKERRRQKRSEREAPKAGGRSKRRTSDKENVAT